MGAPTGLLSKNDPMIPRFVAVSNPQVKRQIHQGAEAEEYDFYRRRAPQEWLDALSPFGTDEIATFI